MIMFQVMRNVMIAQTLHGLAKQVRRQADLDTDLAPMHEILFSSPQESCMAQTVWAVGEEL